jgi:hypothetical protein
MNLIASSYVLIPLIFRREVKTGEKSSPGMALSSTHPLIRHDEE